MPEEIIQMEVIMKTSSGATGRQACVLLVLALTLVLTACGGHQEGGTGTAARLPQRVEDVHAAFLAALRTHDRAQVLALTVDDDQAARADEFLQRVRAYGDSTITSGPYVTGGTLQDVRVIRVERAGGAAQGWSRWQYAKKAICHATELTETAAGWRVLEFSVSGSDAQCTP